MNFPQLPSNNSRIFGLDIARAVSIFFVLITHLFTLPEQMGFNVKEYSNLITTIGIMGVEVLFVLSGFLIGGILIRDVLPNPSIDKIRIFLIRRWLRTLPAYYTVLIVLVGCDFLFTNSTQYRWDYFLFFQNYTQGAESFFASSWTLPIEQWTYLLAPCVLISFPFLLQRLSKKYPKLWISSRESELFGSVLCILVFFLMLRILAVFIADPLWDSGIRKQIHFRLDAIWFGILIVFCKYFLQDLYYKISKLSFFLSILFLLALSSWSVYRDLCASQGIDSSFFQKTFGFTLYPGLLALTLPFFDINPLVNARLYTYTLVRKSITFLCTYSYSLYLVHFNVYIVVRSLISRIELSSLLAKVFVCCMGSIFALGVTFFLAQLLYHVVEKPGMDLRKYIR